MSLSSHTYVTALGNAPYVGIPAFIFRAFRHSAIYIRTETAASRNLGTYAARGSGRPSISKPRTSGRAAQSASRVRVLTSEACTGARAALRKPAAANATPLDLPPAIDCKPIPHDRTLSELFDTGELDALMSPRAPRSFVEGKSHVAQLFPDYPSVELAYFQKTRIFPIMHPRRHSPGSR